ncbi:squamosa promoter-binding-like protein 15 [Impatiens glandulifera]|uniref:squamosa promoter-binding-like protein 15 n=1 Tax=Impatiens glandulifera TaxID=253017 RepID=UPI001FB0CC43|nr:squamosa promoter-binding-like protein 15 [Impatiens glandulifera]
MDEFGAQFVPPIFIQQQLSGRFRDGPSHQVAKKRSFPPIQSTSSQPHQQQATRFQNSVGQWNASAWDWDSVGFSAKQLGSDETGLNNRSIDQVDGSLSLKLGGVGGGGVEEIVQKTGKRIRAGSPSGGNYPMCQVDDCREDLSKAKDYHRRHKVCEVHSKSSKTVVGKQLQRFCQQCSKFHPLTEFDEGKRSCRRRLAGHNKRRRKTQTEDIGRSENSAVTATANMDIVNLLRAGLSTTGPSQDQLIQILNKINSLPLPVPMPVDLQPKPTGIVPNQALLNPTMDLLTVFSSPEGNNIQPKVVSRVHYSSESSSPMDESSSPSSSPLVVQKLFPMHERITTSQEEANPKVERSRGQMKNNSFVLFGESIESAENDLFHSPPYQAAEQPSSSGSDHSPSSLSSDSQDRTGRIIIKLFDKDPSHLPGGLRTQIFDWLSHSPSEMESYIRPGCVVLSIYISMSSAAWDQLEENLVPRVSSLVHHSDTDFWRSGRFLIRTDNQLASYKDGKIRHCKSWRTHRSPELLYVSPLAIIRGKESSLMLKGKNLNTPGTKIHYTHTGGGYSSKEVGELAFHETRQDELSLVNFTINEKSSEAVGRCFIEVENGFRGTSFPIIIADAAISEELQTLESEFEEYNEVRRKGVLHFLNELGWLFQRKRCSSGQDMPDFSLSRFKFLLIFSVERNCCSLVKTVLDIILERILNNEEQLRISSKMLSEIQLLNTAVKMKHKDMVRLLIRYSVLNNNSEPVYIFSPNQAGPGGITPLHLAACLPGLDEVVDALTSDPQEIGLRNWNTLLDNTGQSPSSYASMRNNHSYNSLVSQKQIDRNNNQVSLSIETESDPQHITNQNREFRRRINPNQAVVPSSCSKCAAKYKAPGSSHGSIHRPYILSMLAIAAVCACVCLFYRGAPDIGRVNPFKWERLNYGYI